MPPTLPRCMTTPLDIPFLTSNPQASPPISRTEQTNTCLQGLSTRRAGAHSQPQRHRASRPPARHETRPLSCTETPYSERQTCVLTQVRRYTQKAPRQSSIVKELSRKPITRSFASASVEAEGSSPCHSNYSVATESSCDLTLLWGVSDLFQKHFINLAR